MSRTEPQAVAADCVFDGTALHEHAAVIIDGAEIAGLVGRRELPRSMQVVELPSGTWLAPGFIDVQVNGGGDVLFNAAPAPEGIAAIVAAHRSLGTTAMLPTLITDSDDKMLAALSAVQAMIGIEPGVLGIHFEGPFISPAQPGVHRREFIRLPGRQHVKLLTGLRGGVTLVTLAPEQVPAGFIAQLTAAGVKVSLGHSMATYGQTRAAMAEGVTGFTHLFNAMRPLESREPGPIAVALESSEAWYGLIVDGHHVHPAMLRLALRGRGHPLLVTDAMPPVGGMRTAFTLYDEEIAVEDGRCATRDGTLAGASIDMGAAVRNCVRLLDLPLERALHLASTAPARFLGLDSMLGRIAPGCRADLVALDPRTITVLGVWTAGKNASKP